MNLRHKINSVFSSQTRAGIRPLHACRALAAFLLASALLMSGGATARGQGASPTPVKEADIAELAPARTDKMKDSPPVPATQQQDSEAEPKKEKHGTFIIAPIPITSPAIGSGLVVGLGYVFKVNPEDKLSPPSTVGLVGAFTSSGTRGGALGADQSEPASSRRRFDIEAPARVRDFERQ